MTQDYYGTKRIRAWRDDRSGENQMPAGEGYAVIYADGYRSWSPKDVFEAAYQPITAMSFGHALVALKEGHKVARAGWNGKGMWLVLVAGTPAAQLRDGTPYKIATGLDECEILPHIDMWTVNADGRRAMLPGWLASQTDMLADDWQIIE
ncbi:DUF2829 domain-containing protein [Thalassospira xiamenensis]|uniref:DUF2829 domain-containing protein n=1 Tax=Thalassospira xiamenensis TaxID=220697 RepID=UPI003AA9404D